MYRVQMSATDWQQVTRTSFALARSHLSVVARGENLLLDAFGKEVRRKIEDIRQTGTTSAGEAREKAVSRTKVSTENRHHQDSDRKT